MAVYKFERGRSGIHEFRARADIAYRILRLDICGLTGSGDTADTYKFFTERPLSDAAKKELVENEIILAKSA